MIADMFIIGIIVGVAVVCAGAGWISAVKWKDRCARIADDYKQQQTILRYLEEKGVDVKKACEELDELHRIKEKSDIKGGK